MQVITAFCWWHLRVQWGEHKPNTAKSGKIMRLWNFHSIFCNFYDKVQILLWEDHKKDQITLFLVLKILAVFWVPGSYYFQKFGRFLKSFGFLTISELYQYVPYLVDSISTWFCYYQLLINYSLVLQTYTIFFCIEFLIITYGWLHTFS